MNTKTPAPLPATTTRASPDCPQFCSEQLFRHGREVLIRHQGELYRLQLTRNGKLILIK